MISDQTGPVNRNRTPPVSGYRSEKKPWTARARLRALGLAGLWVDHGVIAGAEVACLLAGARRHAAAAVAADIAHLVAHLLLPVVAATHHATRRAVCSIDRSAENK